MAFHQETKTVVGMANSSQSTGTSAERLQCSAKIITAHRYRIRALTLRENTFVAILKGHKILHSANGEIDVGPGQGVMIARDTQWDIINDPCTESHYEAIFISFDDQVIQLFENQYGSGLSTKVSSAKIVHVGKELLVSLQRTLYFAESEFLSETVFRHRILEILLWLSEQGYSFSSRCALSWPDPSPYTQLNLPSRNLNLCL